MNKKLPPKRWKVQIESVYKMDREERIKQACEIILPEVHTNPDLSVMEGNNHATQKNSPIRKSF